MMPFAPSFLAQQPRMTQNDTLDTFDTPSLLSLSIIIGKLEVWKTIQGIGEKEYQIAEKRNC